MNLTPQIPAAPAGNFISRNLLLLALPPALILPCWVWFFWRVKLPFWDQFTMSLTFEKFYGSRLSFADLWEPYNGHRILFYRVISLGLGVLTRWNVGLEALVANVFNVATFVLILRELGHSLRRVGGAAPPAVLLFLSGLWFSMNQYENWFNGWMLGLLLSELCSVGALLLLCREGLPWRGLAGATALAALSTFTFGGGLATWPVGFLAILLGTSARKAVSLAVWVAATLVSAALYASGPAPGGAAGFMGLARVPGYLASYLGGAIFSINGEKATFLGPTLQFGLSLVAPAVGVLGVLAALWGYVHARRRGVDGRALNFPLMLCLFALVDAGLTTVTRAQFGQAQAMSPHYISISRLLWVGAALLHCVSGETSPTGAPRGWQRAAGAAVAAMMLASYANGLKHLREWHRTQLAVQTQLWTRYDDATLRELCPVLTLAQLHQGAEALKRDHLAHHAGVPASPGTGVYAPAPAAAGRLDKSPE